MSRRNRWSWIFLRQYPEKDLVIQAAKAVGDITLDKPSSPGPGVMLSSAVRYGTLVLAGTRVNYQRTAARNTPQGAGGPLRRLAYPDHDGMPRGRSFPFFFGM